MQRGRRQKGAPGGCSKELALTEHLTPAVWDLERAVVPQLLATHTVVATIAFIVPVPAPRLSGAHLDVRCTQTNAWTPDPVALDLSGHQP